MSLLAVRLPENLVKQAHKYAQINMRTVPKQIEYWVMLGRCAEDNPDLPMSFIKNCLFAKNEIEQDKTSGFVFRTEA